MLLKVTKIIAIRCTLAHFVHYMIDLDYSGIDLKLRHTDNGVQVCDPVRKLWVMLTPEEHVRQHLLYYLSVKLQYPASLIAVEKKILFGRLTKRFDIVVYERND